MRETETVVASKPDNRGLMIGISFMLIGIAIFLI